MKKDETEEHGIAGAVYTLVQSGQYEPTLSCLCGESFQGYNWEDAGHQLDNHLEDTLAGEKE